MGRLSARIAIGAIALGLTAIALPAHAQSNRTWVSGVGDDANPCSRTAPCKSFARAYSLTAAGGEIDCLDAGGFGGLTITRSVSIICDDVPTGVMGAGTNAILVNAGANDVVVLKGLTIEGAGTGFSGVKILLAGRVEIYDTLISGFTASGSYGVQLAPTSGTVKLLLSDVTITGNATGISALPTNPGSVASLVVENSEISGNSGAGISYTSVALPINTPPWALIVRNSSVSNNQAGIVVQSNSSSGNATAVIDNSLISGNSANGIKVTTTAGTLNATVTGSTVTNNNNGVAATSSSGTAVIAVTDSTISYNTAIGVGANGSGAQVWLSGNAIIANADGTNAQGSGTIYSFGDNRVLRNLNTGPMTPVNKT